MRVPRNVLIPTVLLAVAALSACGSSGQTGAGAAPSQSPASSARSSTGGNPGAVQQKHTASPAPSAPHATEFNPPGDIPDNQVFIDYRYPGSRVHLRVPEGWARSTKSGTTTFTDHYNSIALQVVPASSRPTPASVRSHDVPRLRQAVTKFAQPKTSQVARAHGRAVLLTYLQDSAPNSVTGKVVRDASQRYVFWKPGQEAVLTLTGPKTADNVDPWRIVSDSLQWR